MRISQNIQYIPTPVDVALSIGRKSLKIQHLFEKADTHEFESRHMVVPDEEERETSGQTFIYTFNSQLNDQTS